MDFEKKNNVFYSGRATGYVIGYFLFTTVLFLMLSLTHRIHGLSYVHIAGMTILISVIGRYLK